MQTKTAVKFAKDPAETKIIREVAARAVALADQWPGRRERYTSTDAAMDISACHASGCPLRLADLLAADDFNFSHDVFGIRRHIDRTTGRLGDCFRPRFAATGA